MCLIAYERGQTNIKYANPDNPLWAYINITDQCNKFCGFCFNKNNFKPDLALSKFIIILDKLKNMKIKQVTLSGGEPTLHPDIKEMLTLTKELGMRTHLATNGLEDDLILYLDKFKLIDQIQFNWGIDSYKEQLLVINRIKNSRVAVTIPGAKDNVDNLQELIINASKANIDKIRIWELCGAGEAKNSISIQEYDSIASKLIPREYSFKQSYDPEISADLFIPCIIASGVVLYINSAGEILRCMAEINSPVIANILKDPVKTILEKYKKYVAALPKRCFARNEGSSTS